MHDGCLVTRLGSDCKSFFFLSLFSYYVVCQQFPIPSIYNFFHSSPTLSRSLLMQSSITISVFLAFISTLFSGYLFALPVFLIPFLHMTNSCTPYQFLLRTFLHSNLYSHFIIFLLSALLTPTMIPTRLFFTNLDLLLFLCYCHRL